MVLPSLWVRSRACGGRTLTSFCQHHTHIHEWVKGWARASPCLAERWHLVFISAHYTTVNLPMQTALPLSTPHTLQPALHMSSPRGTLQWTQPCEKPSKIYPVTCWEMEVISTTPQLACSARTADSTAILSHSEEWDLIRHYHTDRVVATVETAGWRWLLCDYSASFPSNMWVMETNALCLGVKNIWALSEPGTLA